MPKWKQLLYTRIEKPMKQGNHDLVAIERNKTLILELRLKNPGMTLDSLAEEFQRITGQSIGRSSVDRYLAEAKKEWAMARTEDYNYYVHTSMMRLDLLEQEAWDAYRRSIEADFTEEFSEVTNPGNYIAMREAARKASRAVQVELTKQGAGTVDRESIEDVIMQSIPPETYMALSGERAGEGEEGSAQGMVMSRVTRLVRRGPGNERILKTILDIQRERNKIQGVYSPDKHAIHVRQEVFVKGYSGAWSPDAWDRNVVEGVIEPVEMIGDGLAGDEPVPGDVQDD